MRSSEATPQADIVGQRRLHLLALHLADEPLAGKLYTVRSGDTPDKIARRVLSQFGRYTATQARDYWHCVSGGAFNQGRYGTYSTSKRYPAELLVPGQGMGIRAAFMRCNEDAIAAMASGFLARRGVDVKSGTPLGLGDHLGTIWLPYINPDLAASGEITCRGMDWPCGTSGLEPDPELLALMETR